MLDWLVEWFTAYPYLGVALVFLACGLGFPLPEEIVLLFAGYVTFRELADREVMMVVCATAIVAGDLLPYVLGRTFGPSLLRIRLFRWFVTPERLARFDRWFRRRGQTVVIISRFIPGIRLVAFFTAGTMRMSYVRFLSLDLAGIAVIVPPLVWLGNYYGDAIESVVAWVQRIERGILYAAIGAGAAIGGWYWLRWRRQQQLLVGAPTDTYVEPSAPVRSPNAEDRDADASRLEPQRPPRKATERIQTQKSSDEPGAVPRPSAGNAAPDDPNRRSE